MGSCEHDKHLVPYVRALAYFNPSLRNLRTGGSGALSQDEAGFFPSSSLISKYMMRPEDSITYFEKDAFFLSEVQAPHSLACLPVNCGVCSVLVAAAEANAGRPSLQSHRDGSIRGVAEVPSAVATAGVPLAA